MHTAFELLHHEIKHLIRLLEDLAPPPETPEGRLLRNLKALVADYEASA